jgi:hypothetical protein
MGSSFIAYGAILAIMLLIGQDWLARRNRSQEFFDSVVITLWGSVFFGNVLILDLSILSQNIDGDPHGLIRISSILPWVHIATGVANNRYHLVLRRSRWNLTLLAKGQTSTKHYPSNYHHSHWVGNGRSRSIVGIFNQYACPLWTHAHREWRHSYR